MKISINDENGSQFMTARTLDGKKPVIGVDYKEWTGKFHKNGKWSYTEGGIMTQNLAYAVWNGSTHSRANGVVEFFVVENDKIIRTEHVGKVDELEMRPCFEGLHAVALNALWRHYERNYVEYDWLKKEWDDAEKFTKTLI